MFEDVWHGKESTHCWASQVVLRHSCVPHHHQAGRTEIHGRNTSEVTFLRWLSDPELGVNLELVIKKVTLKNQVFDCVHVMFGCPVFCLC